MERPLFSIITITFNAAGTLPATLRSVERQTFTDYEYLIVDGASTDGTVAIAQHSAAVSSVTSEPDKGLYDAMNKGLRFSECRRCISRPRYVAENRRFHRKNRPRYCLWRDGIGRFGKTFYIHAEVTGPRKVIGEEFSHGDAGVSSGVYRSPGDCAGI